MENTTVTASASTNNSQQSSTFNTAPRKALNPNARDYIPASPLHYYIDYVGMQQYLSQLSYSFFYRMQHFSWLSFDVAEGTTLMIRNIPNGVRSLH